MHLRHNAFRVPLIASHHGDVYTTSSQHQSSEYSSEITHEKKDPSHSSTVIIIAAHLKTSCRYSSLTVHSLESEGFHKNMYMGKNTFYTRTWYPFVVSGISWDLGRYPPRIREMCARETGWSLQQKPRGFMLCKDSVPSQLARL